MASKLTVDPSEPALQVPSDSQQNLTLTLKNPTGEKIGFKVKCTNNTRFKIRPVVGIIDANGLAAVGVTVEPVDKKPDTKDCFGVYETPATSDDAAGLWKNSPPSEVNYVYVKYTDAQGTVVEVAAKPAEAEKTLTEEAKKPLEADAAQPFPDAVPPAEA